MSTAAESAPALPEHRDHERLPARIRALVGLEALLAVGALGGALGLLTGWTDLGPSTAELPLASPVLAGTALGVLIGVLPVAVALGAAARRPWADGGHLVVGVVLVGWIVVQVGFIGLVSWLQPLFAAYGLAIVALAVGSGPRRA